MSEFKVGEIAVYVNNSGITVYESRPGIISEHDGQECEIISGLIVIHPEFDALGYRVKFSDGVILRLASRHLRKRKPPEQPADEDFQRDLDRWLKRDREVVV